MFICLNVLVFCCIQTLYNIYSHDRFAYCVACFRATVFFYNNIVSSIILYGPFFMSIPFKEKASSLPYHSWHSTANSIGPCSCRIGNKPAKIPNGPRHASWNTRAREEKTPLAPLHDTTRMSFDNRVLINSLKISQNFCTNLMETRPACSLENEPGKVEPGE